MARGDGGHITGNGHGQWFTRGSTSAHVQGREHGRGGEEELGTELYSQEFTISKAAVNQTLHTPIYLVKRYSHRE